MQKKIAIVGYGNQAQAWAKNLKDSGWVVGIILRPKSKSMALAQNDGFLVAPLANLIDFTHIAILIPDHQIESFAQEATPYLSKAEALVFAHGFCLHFKTATWPEHLDLILLAPKGIATAVRERYLASSGVPAVTSIEKNRSGNAQETLSVLAEGLGFSRVGLYPATAAQEVTADLLSEQSLLCGGVPYLLKATFDVLVAKGIPAEVAYLECVHELAFMSEQFASIGVAATMQYASPTAQLGGTLGGERLITRQVRNELEELLNDIQSGKFKKRLDEEATHHFVPTQQKWNAYKDATIETIGQKVRNRLKGAEDETKND